MFKTINGIIVKIKMVPVLRFKMTSKMCFYAQKCVRGTLKQYQKQQMCKIFDGKWL